MPWRSVGVLWCWRKASCPCFLFSHPSNYYRLDMYQIGTVASSSVAPSLPSSTPATISSMSNSPSQASTLAALPIPSSTPVSSSTSTYSAVKGTATNAKPNTKTFDWSIGWVNASPDGFVRPMVGINGVWPCPPINANIGDTIKINVVNNLGNQSTSIHFHGLFQQNSNFEDGPVGVTQCPIQPGGCKFDVLARNPITNRNSICLPVQTSSIRYILVSRAHWRPIYRYIHLAPIIKRELTSIDGFRGPVTIKDNLALNNYGTIDQEFTLSLTDLYHVEAPHMVNYFLSPNNFLGAEPVPDSALINEAQNSQYTIVPGKTYLFHIVNMGALAGHFLQFDQHDMTIVEVDGTYTVPSTVSQIFVAVAQRYSVIVKAKETKSQNFAIVSQFATDMFDSTVTPVGQIANVSLDPEMCLQKANFVQATSFLIYDPALPLPLPFALEIQPWDDTALVPYDQEPMWDGPNVQL